MEMTPEEIHRSYRQAKFPQEQVKILADLNLCSRAKIVQTLIEQGVDPKELPKLTARDHRTLSAEKAPPRAPDPDVLEREIEDKLRTLIKRYKGRCLKWVCPGEAGVPDRLVLLPGGRVVFVETKRPKGGKLSKLQLYWGRTLRGLGFEAWVVWTREDLENFEKKVLGK